MSNIDECKRIRDSFEEILSAPPRTKEEDRLLKKMGFQSSGDQITIEKQKAPIGKPTSA